MRLPTSTYRLQFTCGLRFGDAARWWNVSTPGDHRTVRLALSCPARSVPRYEVVSRLRLNPELGTEQDFQRFAGGLRERRMGLLLDVVPNHMCIDSGELAAGATFSARPQLDLTRALAASVCGRPRTSLVGKCLARRSPGGDHRWVRARLTVADAGRAVLVRLRHAPCPLPSSSPELRRAVRRRGPVRARVDPVRRHRSAAEAHQADEPVRAEADEAMSHRPADSSYPVADLTDQRVRGGPVERRSREIGWGRC